MKICSFGELLIDVTPYGISDKGYPVSEFNPGGAPANVAVAAVKQGLEASFIGQVGDDYFGHFLKSILDENKVDTQGLILNPYYPTSLAIVSLKENGERSFSFYRKNGADVMVDFNSDFQIKIDEADAFHCGSVSLSDDPARSATMDMLKYARHQNKLISFDVNLRVLLWDNLFSAKLYIDEALAYVDVLKVSEEELAFVRPDLDEQGALRSLMHAYPLKMILVTYGEKGSAVFTKTQWITMPSFKVNAIDTTGAGDAFFGAFLAGLYGLSKSIEDCSAHELKILLKRANACGAIATLKKGAIGSLPTQAQLVTFLKDHHEKND